MRDIPMFSTSLGAASLTLSQVPYRADAYVWVQSVRDEDLPAFLDECVAFCRSVGARRVYATNHPGLVRYPLHCRLIEMRAAKETVTPGDCSLFPVVPENAKHWAEIYNQRMKDVPAAAYLDDALIRKLPGEKDAYFVHRDGKLLGIGRAKEDRILVVATTEPGAGEQIVKAMAELLDAETIVVECAEENGKAIHLYERLGFLKTQVKTQWYQIF